MKAALTLGWPYLKRGLRRSRRWAQRWLPSILAAYLIVAVLSYLTNPFTRYTLVNVPYQISLQADGQLAVVKQDTLRLRTSLFYGAFAKVKSGYHILSNALTGTKRSEAETLDEIIRDIHRLRFDPNEPYLISGDHFSVFYNRSLGIFYHTLLDPRTALDAEDWLNRQKIYLQSTAYALSVYRNSEALSTTIVPVGESSVALMNIYSPPSDTLYSLLYALDVMSSTTTLENIYPYIPTQRYPLLTVAAAQQLLADHRPTLIRHYRQYQERVIDPQTGLIRQDILLSGTKDISKRQGAFYDNVIFWRTTQLAQKLGLIPTDQAYLDQLKAKILATYWQPEMGCFLEDLAPEAVAGRYYSSDWLIVLKTGFLDPFTPAELPYYLGCVRYIQAEGLDQPFGLKYQQERRDHRLYPVVRIGAPEYGSTTIWSNWGMEYTKLLALIYQVSGQPEYLDRAQAQITAYTENILRYGCYPEVYDQNGKMFHRILYKSICQTGWVVTYEQARDLVEFVGKERPPEAQR